MLKLNLWDMAFKHLETFDGKYSMVHEKVPKHIIYTRGHLHYNGITIFTDDCLHEDLIRQVDSVHKIGWLIENRNIVPGAYHRIDSYINLLDFVMTNDVKLLNDYPNKTKFVPFGGGWIKEDNFGIKDKSKLLSIIYSNKRHTFDGYELRHEIANKYSHIIDLYGNGSPNPIENKELGLSDYMFSVVIENVREDNYFTEKIVDPMLVGTVPIYWGCPNISTFFNDLGMMKFNNLEEFDILLNRLNDRGEDIYGSMSKSILDNFNRAREYEITEDWIYHNILRGV
jgi:hypothetical protein